MGEKYPQTFLVGADGRQREHGSRGNNALNDPTYLRLSQRVITEMARRYGKFRNGLPQKYFSRRIRKAFELTAAQ